jgi:hypothetical protein
MKKILIALILGYISFSALIGIANAQSTGNVVAFTDTKAFMKSIQTIASRENSVFLVSINAPDESNVSMKAIKDFKGRFGAATNEKWFAIRGGFISYFKLNGFGDRVFYDKKGHWQGSLILYNEDGLPHEIRAIVKSQNYDYAITLVEEVETTSGGVYLVHLEDKTSFKIVRVTKEGEMDVMEEFLKG